MVLQVVLRQTGRSCAFPLLCLALFLSLPLTGFASVKKITLAWDSSAGSDIAGYRLHYGTSSGSYSNHTDIGMATAYTVEGLPQGTYFFAITAYNRSGQESGYSNEVQYSIPAPPPTVTRISDTSGPVGMQLSISGENFGEDARFYFNGIPAVIVNSSPDNAVVSVPSGFTSGPVTVSTPAGSAVAAQFTATPPRSRAAIAVPGGGTVDYGTIGPSSQLNTGYAMAEAAQSFYALSFLSHAQHGVVSSTMSLSPSVATRSVRIAVEHRLAPEAGMPENRTGVSLVNSGSSPATLQLTLRDNEGNALPARTLNLSAGEHAAEFLDQLFEIPEDFGLGTLDVSSNLPVSVLALRLTVNQLGRLLLSSAPMADLSEPAAPGALYFARMAVGGGYQTTVVLFNTSGQEQTGEIHMIMQSGVAMNEARAVSPYAIKPGGVYGLTTKAGNELIPGWVEIVPDEGSATPAGGLIIGFGQEGVLSAETSFPSVQPVKHVLLPVDESGGLETSVAFVNPGLVPARIDVNAIKSNLTVGTGVAVNLSANESAGGYVRELFGNSLPEGFKGVLEMTSTEPFLPVGLQSFVNPEGYYVFTNIPILDPSRAAGSAAIFPQLADGGGFETRFVFVNPEDSAVPIELKFLGDRGQPIAVGR